ncbi:hypothetical protein E2562_010519 [Oryza meyeriana var. granulata]|uniref:Uncharacterized protein n=1 Tax=Oryza meyeriana var. granulata TaxID=110450 RepID=A0A6G1DVL8_9ORYZ|nr:hypothetical protein E2562_010519 [Oryza meyeriana var. granulata]
MLWACLTTCAVERLDRCVMLSTGGDDDDDSAVPSMITTYVFGRGVPVCAVMPTAAEQETGAGDETSGVVGMVVIVLFFGSLFAYNFWILIHQDPVFSFSLTEVAGGLEDLARSPVIRPDFGLTLRVDNQQIARNCREEVTVTVFYDDTVVGWADVPDFCVDKWTTAELEVPRGCSAHLRAAPAFVVGTLFWESGADGRDEDGVP